MINIFANILLHLYRNIHVCKEKRLNPNQMIIKKIYHSFLKSIDNLEEYGHHIYKAVSTTFI